MELLRLSILLVTHYLLLILSNQLATGNNQTKLSYPHFVNKSWSSNSEILVTSV